MRPNRHAIAKGFGQPAAWANAVLTSAGLCFLLLFLHLLLTYNFYSSPSVPHYYYLIAILGTILSLLALKLPQAIKLKLILIMVSIVFALYLSELALYLLTPTSNLELAKKNGIPFDPRTKLEVVEDLRSRGVEAYPSVHAGIELKDRALLTL